MKKFGMIHIPVMSFFSKELYQDVGGNWKGVNFFYLFLVLAVCWVPAMMRIQGGLTNFVDNDAPKIIEQIPEITVTDGEASITSPEPYYIKDPDSGDVMVIIDTTGETTSLEATTAICLLTKDSVMTKKNEIETRSYDLSSMQGEFIVTSEKVTGWAEIVKKFLVIAIYPGTVLGSFMVRIIQALTYGGLGLWFASMCKTELSYGTSVRLSVVAMTPCLLAKTFFGMAHFHMPFRPLIFVAITLIYLYVAVKANSEIVEVAEIEGHEVLEAQED